jgi:ABC-type uncharacterized transport system permease subunit
VVLVLIAQFLRYILKPLYSTKYSYLLEILPAGLSISFYYFLNEIFASSFHNISLFGEMDYLEFLIIGESLIALPIYFLEGTFRKTKQSIAEGVWDSLSHLSINPIKALINLMINSLPRELFRIFMLVGLSYFIFEFSFNPLLFLVALLVIIILSPVFFSLGLFCSLALLKNKKCSGVVIGSLRLLALLGGSLCPISFLPSSLFQVLLVLPYSRLIYESTLYITQNNISNFSYVILFLPYSALIPLSIILFKNQARFKDSNSMILK